jgi:hypothetical protein
MTSRSSFSDDSSLASPSLEFARQALVFFRRAGLLGLHPIDHADQKLHLLLEPIDRFEVHTARCCLNHV